MITLSRFSQIQALEDRLLLNRYARRGGSDWDFEELLRSALDHVFGFKPLYWERIYFPDDEDLEPLNVDEFAALIPEDVPFGAWYHEPAPDIQAGDYDPRKHDEASVEEAAETYPFVEEDDVQAWAQNGWNITDSKGEVLRCLGHIRPGVANVLIGRAAKTREDLEAEGWLQALGVPSRPASPDPRAQQLNRNFLSLGEKRPKRKQPQH